MSSSLVRLVLRHRIVSVPRPSTHTISPSVISRNYAKNHRKGASSVTAPVPKATDTHTDFVPPRGSKGHKSQHEDITPNALSEEDEVIYQAGQKMDNTLEWYKRELAQMEARVSGRVVPSLLDPVRVRVKGSEGAAVRLDEVATVGVRDGNVLVITLFDEAVCSCSTQKPPSEY
jgi:ribosome recycling factor